MERVGRSPRTTLTPTDQSPPSRTTSCCGTMIEGVISENRLPTSLGSGAGRGGVREHLIHGLAQPRRRSILDHGTVEQLGDAVARDRR